jgi:hypothetical protein
LVDSCLRRLYSSEPAPQVAVTIVVKGLAPALNPTALVEERAGLQYVVSYVPAYAGDYEIEIRVNGDAIYGSPFSLSWIAGSVCKAYEPSKISAKVLLSHRGRLEEGWTLKRVV